MSNKGFSHIGLSTLDLDKTRDFYEGVLGFKVVRCDIIKIKEGGYIRHMFVEIGHDQMIAFMEPNNVDAIPSDYDAGINDGLGVPGPFYHFAFEAGSEAALEAKRIELIDKGQTVTDIVDHEWAKSLHNATVGEPDPQKRKALADEIEPIANRHEPHDREIDLEWAKSDPRTDAPLSR